MPFSAAGTSITPRVVFNSGYIDFGSNRIVNLESATLGIEWTTAPLYVVNSIVPQAMNRHTQKITLTGKIRSFAAETFALAMGSSTIGTPNTLIGLDGQPTLVNPVANLYDSAGKQYQYQFGNAMFKSFKTNVKMEDYADFDFELEASTLSILYTT